MSDKQRSWRGVGVGLVGLVVGLVGGLFTAYAADLLSVDDGMKVRFRLSGSGATHIDADDGAEPGLRVTNTGSAPAALQVDSTQGALVPPRMTTAQRDAIATPPTGGQIYNTSTSTIDFYDGTAWVALGPPGPVFVSGAVIGVTMDLTYTSQNGLATAPSPSNGDFSIGGTLASPQTVTGVSVTSTVVTLTLSPGVVVTDTVTVSYTPGTNKIKDALTARPAAALSAQPVANDSATFDEDFSTDAFTDLDPTHIGVAAGVMHVHAQRDGTNDASYLDLVTPLSNTAWVMRFEADLTTVVQNASSASLLAWIVISDSPSDSQTPQDSIGMGWEVWSANKMAGYTHNDNGVVQLLSNFADPSRTVQVEKYWVEIVRTSATTMTINLSSSSAFSADLSTKTGIPISAAIAGLRYIKVLNRSDATSEDHDLVVDIDNLRIWDGVTSAP